MTVDSAVSLFSLPAFQQCLMEFIHLVLVTPPLSFLVGVSLVLSLFLSPSLQVCNRAHERC